MKNPLVCLVLIAVWISPVNTAFAATVPAGTTLVARTAAPISSHATAGRHFTAQLGQSVAVDGRVILPAGTQLYGIIATSRGSRSTTSSHPLTLNLTAVSANGRKVPVKTTGSVEPHAAKTTRQSRGGFTFGENTFPAGTTLEFRLAEPLNL